MVPQDGESETSYSARAASHITVDAMQRVGVAQGEATERDLYAGGLFVFVLANHLTYVLEASFEQAASLGLLMLLVANGMDKLAAAASNAPIANTYNLMTTRKDKYLMAVGGQFVKWTLSPTEERMHALAQLYDTGRKHVT
jgi:hypothetical protein